MVGKLMLNVGEQDIQITPRVQSDNPDVPVDQIPARMVYTSSEYTNNAEAVQAAVSSSELGSDKNNVKLWWDKK